MRRSLAFGFAFVALAALPLTLVAQDAIKFGTWGVDLTSIDPAVKPGDNFFLHVNGKWLATAAIPPDRSQTGSFQDLQILSERRLSSIVDDLAKTPDAKLTGEERKLKPMTPGDVRAWMTANKVRSTDEYTRECAAKAARSIV